MINLTPFLLFDGNCAEAMAFYQSCLNGELTITKVADTPMKDQMPPEHHHKVVHSHLKSDAIEFSATDWLHPRRTPRQGNTVAMYVNGGTYLELRAIFDRLAAGADKELLDDLRDLPFGTYGHLADKYGIHWFFQGEKKGDTYFAAGAQACSHGAQKEPELPSSKCRITRRLGNRRQPSH